MSERRKRVADIKAGDGVVLSPHCHGTIIRCKPSHSTMVKPKAGGFEGLAWIVVFEALDGPHKGDRAADFLHESDTILCR